MYVKVTRLSVLNPPLHRNLPGSQPVGRALPKPPRIAKVKPVKLSKDDILMADFEGKEFGDWTAEGQLSNLPTVTKGRIHGLVGKRVLDTFLANNGDQPTGTLTSQGFKIDRKRINFLIGGGKHPRKTGVNLLVDGEVVISATGNSTKTKPTKRFSAGRVGMFRKHMGKNARIQIFDQHWGWGHIVVDHIYRSDKAPYK